MIPIRRGLGTLVNSLLLPFGLQVRRQLGPRYLRELSVRTVLDIGANAGQFARKTRALLPNATIHSFEPLPEPCEELRRWAARDKSMFIHSLALGDAEGEAEIHRNSFSPSSSFLPVTQIHTQSFPGTGSTKSLRVPIARLDYWATTWDLSDPILIKLDVQGYEDRVLRGGEKTLKRASALIVEMSFRELYEGQLLFDEIYPLIRHLGYSSAGIDEVVSHRESGATLQADFVFLRTSTQSFPALLGPRSQMANL